jgi:hypothetical protein
MNHVSADNLKELLVLFWIRKLCANGGINVAQVYPVLQPKQEMDVRQAPFLPFASTHEASGIPKGSVLHHKVLQTFGFQPKDSRCYVMSMMGFLSRFELLLNLTPFWVAGECTEQISTTIVSGITESILPNCM